MVLKECYYVCYRTVDYSEEGKTKTHEDAYLDYANALLVAKELTKCLDLVGNISVIDGSTAEVLDEFESNETIASATEMAKEETIPVFKDIFEDENGGIWRLTDDDKWNYDCTGRICFGCVYCDTSNYCEVIKPMTEEERDIQIKSARKRMGK